MQRAFKYALIFAAVFISFKLILFFLGIHIEHKNWPVMINIGLLPVAMFLTLTEERKFQTVRSTLMADLKVCIRTGILYTVIISGFLFVYYDSINPEFMETLVEERVNLIYLNEDQASNVKGTPKHQVIENTIATARFMLSAKGAFVMSLLAMMAGSIFYAFLITLLQRIGLDRFFETKLPEETIES